MNPIFTGVLVTVLASIFLGSLVWSNIRTNNLISERIYKRKDEEFKFREYMKVLDPHYLKEDEIKKMLQEYTLEELIKQNKKLKSLIYEDCETCR